MSVATTYPGVRVVEVPSSVRTIVGVPTSVTAFVGRALRGPVDDPVAISSFAEFDRTFGGQWADSALGQQVADFFRQGGGAAVVVRVHKSKTNDTASLVLGGSPNQLTLAAASPGAWGAQLSALLNRQTRDPSDTRLYHLEVTDAGANRTEVYDNVSTDTASSRRLDLVLKQQSTLVRVSGSMPTGEITSTAVTQTATNGNDGDPISKDQISDSSLEDPKKGLFALLKADPINLLVIPPYTNAGDIEVEVRTAALTYAEDHAAVFVMDPPAGWTTRALAVTGANAASFTTSNHAALYFPRVQQPDPTRDGMMTTVGAAGAVAGIIASTDATRGVWKAPAGLDARLTGVEALSVPLTDDDIGFLNPIGVNCLRVTPGVGHVVWGARTREGADRLSSQWKYLPVRRLALYIEQSLYQGLQWVVFEANDEPLWSQIRLNVGSFMNQLFRQGAFQGTSPRAAYFVKCDKDTTTQADRDLGVVNIDVGFAPVKPAEFVILRLQQMAGQITT